MAALGSGVEALRQQWPLQSVFIVDTSDGALEVLPLTAIKPEHFDNEVGEMGCADQPLHTHTHTHTHIHTYIHTYTHTHTQTQNTNTNKQTNKQTKNDASCVRRTGLTGWERQSHKRGSSRHSLHTACEVCAEMA